MPCNDVKPSHQSGQDARWLWCGLQIFRLHQKNNCTMNSPYFITGNAGFAEYGAPGTPQHLGDSTAIPGEST